MTDQKKIDELQGKLDKLKGTNQPQGLLDRIPHIKIGDKKPIQYDQATSKLRKIVLYVLTIIVGAVATILIVAKLIGRFLQ